MIICTTNKSPKHIEQLKAMIESVAVNSPNDEIAVYLLDFNDNDVPDLSAINLKCSIIRRDEGTALISANKIAPFMWRYRSIMMRDALYRFDQPILYLDTDILVRKNLSKFWSDIGPNTIKVMVRETKDRTAMTQAGVFAVGNSDETRNMMEFYNENVQSKPQPFVEQEWLYRAINHHLEVKHIQLKDEFNDWHFNDNSTIWHSKGKHFHEKKFQTEYQNYLGRANAKLQKIHQQ